MNLCTRGHNHGKTTFQHPSKHGLKSNVGNAAWTGAFRRKYDNAAQIESESHSDGAVLHKAGSDWVYAGPDG